MPYIDKDRRKFLMSQTYKQLLEIADEMHAGDMNFLISTLLWMRFAKGQSYATGNAIMGILECVKHEFYRQILGPYEDQAIQRNGNLMLDVSKNSEPPLKAL